MDSADTGRPVLRLASPDVASSPRVSRARAAVAAVRSENRAASELSARDARWALAVAAANSVEGGVAGVISPEKRRRLVSMGARLGLRPFDANLVIAIVQDGARTGSPLSSGVEERLSLVRRPSKPERNAKGELIGALAASAALAGLLFLLLLRWLGG